MDDLQSYINQFIICSVAEMVTNLKLWTPIFHTKLFETAIYQGFLNKIKKFKYIP